MNIAATIRMSIIILGIALLTSLGLGGLSYYLYENALKLSTYQQTRDYTKLLSSQVDQKTQSQIHYAHSLLLQSPKSLGRENDEFLALQRFKKRKKEDWKAIQTIIHPDRKPEFKAKDFYLLHQRAPHSFAFIEHSQGPTSLLEYVEIPSERKAIRITTRLNKNEYLEIYVDQDEYMSFLTELGNGSHSKVFHFLVNSHGQVLAQSEPHFSLGENLSHIPLSRKLFKRKVTQGRMEYEELPGADLQIASFKKAKFSGVSVISQIPKKHIWKSLEKFKVWFLVGIMIQMTLLCISIFFAAWAYFNWKIKLLKRVVRDFSEHYTLPPFKELIQGKDDFSDLSETLESLFKELKDAVDQGYVSSRSKMKIPEKNEEETKEPEVDTSEIKTRLGIDTPSDFEEDLNLEAMLGELEEQAMNQSDHNDDSAA